MENREIENVREIEEKNVVVVVEEKTYGHQSHLIVSES